MGGLMTCSCFSAEARRNRALARQANQSAKQEATVQKLLLLGAGGSGKSTFFKQLRLIHGKGINKTEIENTYRDVVYSNVLNGMQTLVEKSLEIQDTNPELKTQLEPKNVEHANYIVEFDEDEFQNQREKLCKAISELWKDKGILACWEVRSRFHIQDSAEHFFENIGRITDEKYVPSEDDILRARIRTTGIVQQEFFVKGTKFQVFDVGGQRNERKKWIHCFEDVTAVLFLAALSAYDQTLFEDDKTNRMIEALAIFRSIVGNRWFRKTALILFLNKKDIFAQKIKKVPISTCFPEYDGPPHHEIESREYIKSQFVKVYSETTSGEGRKPGKQLFVHYTCALDKDQVKRIFRDVQTLIIHSNLAKADII
jgi:GTPase SAR1 family protein